MGSGRNRMEGVMRILIMSIFILLAGLIKAQDSNQLNDTAQTQDSGQYVNPTFNPKRGALVQNKVIELMIEYEQECYNDSTQVEVYIDPNYNEKGVHSGTLLMGSYKKQWIHKTPTLKGFITWLKDKK